MWELDYKESWALKNWCFWTVVVEKTLESPLDCKEIQPVHPKGNQSWTFFLKTDVEAETPIIWPPYVKKWLIWKDLDAGKDGRREEKGMTEDEMAGWHHWHYGHEFEYSGTWQWIGKPGVLQSMGCKESDMIEWLNWTELIPFCKKRRGSQVNLVFWYLKIHLFCPHIESIINFFLQNFLGNIPMSYNFQCVCF